MNRVKGFINWTKSVISIYFGGLKSAMSKKPTYWDCRQTFFSTIEQRKIYEKKEDLLIKRLSKKYKEI